MGPGPLEGFDSPTLNPCPTPCRLQALDEIRKFRKEQVKEVKKHELELAVLKEQKGQVRARDTWNGPRSALPWGTDDAQGWGSRRRNPRIRTNTACAHPNRTTAVTAFTPYRGGGNLV